MMKRESFIRIILLVGMYFSISILSAQAPKWSINSADFSLDASIIGELQIDNITSTNTDDIIAVFDANDEIRGIAKVSFNTALNKHLVFLSIHSNTNGDELNFKIYDATNDRVLGTNTTLNFTPNQVFGNADTPFVINAESTLSNNDFSLKNNIYFYPNPFVNQLYLKSSKTIYLVEIYSILGKEILVQKINQKQKKIDVQNLQSGIYLLKIIFEDKSIITKKIVKK